MAHDLNVSLCDVCVHKLTPEPTQGTDLTMDYENFRESGNSLKFDALKNADLVQIVNSKLSIVRNTLEVDFFLLFLLIQN